MILLLFRIKNWGAGAVLLSFKKGQLEAQQTIMVVFIVVLLILLGLILFYRYLLADIDNQNKDYERDKFNNLMYTFSLSPEVVCSNYGVSDVLCLDSAKMLAFNALSLEDRYYKQQYGYRNITVRLLYPYENSRICSVNSVECGVWILYENIPESYDYMKIVRKTPVSVYINDKDQYGIGEMVIEGYI